MKNVLTLNIDYHGSMVGITEREIATCSALGFPFAEIVKYLLNRYCLGELPVYNDKSAILADLTLRAELEEFGNKIYELEILRDFLYNDNLSILKHQLELANDITTYNELTKRISIISNLLQTYGKQIDSLCCVMLAIAQHFNNGASNYFGEMQSVCTFNNIPLNCIKPYFATICGGWIVVDFGIR